MRCSAKTSYYNTVYSLNALLNAIVCSYLVSDCLGRYCLILNGYFICFHYPVADGNKKPDGLMFRARDLIVPRAPRSLSVAPAVPSTVGIATTGTSADQVCPSASAPQSAATTPTVTPQQSPTFFRKILANSDLGYSQCKGGRYLNNESYSLYVLRITLRRYRYSEPNACAFLQLILFFFRSFAAY